MSDSLQPHGLQYGRPPCPSPTPLACSNSCPSSQWCIQPSHPLSSPSPPALNLSQHQGLFQWVSSLHQVAKVLEFQLPMNTQDWSPLGWIGWISLQSKGLKSLPQHHSSKHQFLALSFLHSPTLTSIPDHWKNHSLNQTDLCWQSNVSAF